MIEYFALIVLIIIGIIGLLCIAIPIVAILYYIILKPMKAYNKLSPEQQKEQYPYGLWGERYHY
jgi:hypothetical protein